MLNFFVALYRILPELQSVFGHLLESRLQYFIPDIFWKKFKLWGQPVNVREQQDAFDFFCNLTDQVDEQLKVSLSKLSYFIYCYSCVHCYVSLPVPAF